MENILKELEENSSLYDAPVSQLVSEREINISSEENEVEELYNSLLNELNHEVIK